MNKLTAMLAIASLALTFSGCGGYQNYNDGYSGSNYHSHNHRHDDDKPKGPTLQEQQVKALENAAKKGADPTSTLYQQILLQQNH
jgi:hypothetical protein